VTCGVPYSDAQKHNLMGCTLTGTVIDHIIVLINAFLIAARFDL
jgi:hypothetical protein